MIPFEIPEIHMAFTGFIVPTAGDVVDHLHHIKGCVTTAVRRCCVPLPRPSDVSDPFHNCVFHHINHIGRAAGPEFSDDHRNFFNFKIVQNITYVIIILEIFINMKTEHYIFDGIII